MTTQSSSQIRQIVRIVKTDAILGSLPVGAQFEGLFAVALKRDAAVARTFRMLKRDHPGENPMCWTVEGSARSVLDIPCECTGNPPTYEYRKDKRQHCMWCDGLRETP